MKRVNVGQEQIQCSMAAIEYQMQMHHRHKEM